MQTSSIDDFTDVSGWSAVTSGQAELCISRAVGPHGAALRLTYDFKGGGGFVVARKLVRLSLPEAYSFTFMLRGDAPPNNLEFKLVDPSNKSVWRYCRPAFDLPRTWQRLDVRSHDIEFAWGPAGGGPMTQVGAIEIALAAGPGGAGTLCIADLEFEDRSFHSLSSVTASSFVPHHEPECATDRNAATSWRSAPASTPQWYQIDFHSEREYGALIVSWDRAALPQRVKVQSSQDGITWATARTIENPEVRSYIDLPDGAARYLRLQLEPASNAGVGIVHLEVKPFEFSRSVNEFFHGIAARERRGLYPKYFYRRQTYWTSIGVGDGSATALMNEEGMVEVHAGGFSIEPFLHVDGQLITWADARSEVRLEDACLPVPSSAWRHDDISLDVSAFAGAAAGAASLFVRYRVANAGDTTRRVRVLAAVRPFQVTPPWQCFRNLGGVSPIHHIEWDGRGLHVNRHKSVVPLRAPTEVGIVPFAGGNNEAWETGSLPQANEVHDDFGYASAALCYDLELPPGAQEEMTFEIPFGEIDLDLRRLKASLPQGPKARELVSPPDHAPAPPSFETVCADWRRRLATLAFDVPPAARAAIDTLKTATAHILINRDGPALQPGPRRYARSWIRDGAIMAAALLRAGYSAEARDFARWYRRFQRADGSVPCCVDRQEVDELVEHDSHGQLIYVAMEYFRFTGDVDFVREMWPAALKAVDYIDTLRQQRRTAAYQTSDKNACYGLLPESVSHEGYLAQPVHAYWDDFWALRGLKDAAAMADLVGEAGRAEWIRSVHDALAQALYASIRSTIVAHDLSYVPASVEWADFDPTATANAVAMLDESANLPDRLLEQMFETYLADFRRKHAGAMEWTNYSPYEIRIIGALVRRGQRRSAHELLSFFLADRRPLAWNQWPEIAWRDPASPGHLGDLPHTWIAAEYALSLLSMFVFEREADRALVVGAGIPDSWLDDEAGISARGLRTWYGALDLKMRRDATGAVHVVLEGHLTASKLILRPPLAAPLRAVTVNGSAPVAFGTDEVVLDALPAEVVLR